jgi:thioredoxin-dependent peroxiredoxin
MAMVKFKGQPVKTVGELPKVGSVAPDWVLVRTNLSEAKLADYSGKYKLLNVFPSVDTGVCAASVRAFNRKAGQHSDLVVLHISRDLPFAQGRFCNAEAIGSSEPLSAFRSSFPSDYGMEIADGPLKGLCARTVLILDPSNRVVYQQLVDEITTEPDYEAAIAAL